MNLSGRKKITELIESSDLELVDLIEIVDNDAGPSSNPVSRSASLQTLVDFIGDQNLGFVETAPRAVFVDDSFEDNNGPLFNSLELAVDYARGIVNTSGGKVAIQVLYDANGDPLNTNLSNYNWYSSDPADSNIKVFSLVSEFSGSSNFFSQLAVGRDIDLNNIDEDYDLNKSTVDIDLQSSDEVVKFGTDRLKDDSVTPSKVSNDTYSINISGNASSATNATQADNSDTVDNYESDYLLWMTRFIRGDDIDVNNAPYDVDLNEFRVDINLG
jgi:hypothetical protein